MLTYLSRPEIDEIPESNNANNAIDTPIPEIKPRGMAKIAKITDVIPSLLIVSYLPHRK